MYLNLLAEDKKILFRELDIYTAKIDNDFHEKEKEVINYHCMEMNIDNNDFKNKLSLEEVIESIKTTYTIQEVKMAFLELLAVILADDVIESSEKELLDILTKKFCIDDIEKENAINAIVTLKDAYAKMSCFIYGENNGGQKNGD